MHNGHVMATRRQSPRHPLHADGQRDLRMVEAAVGGGSVVALHVYAKAWDGPYGTFEMSREVLADAYEQQARARADELFDAVRRKAEAAGVGFAATAVESDQVWRAVIASAKRSASARSGVEVSHQIRSA